MNELSLWETEDPRSLINIVPDSLKAKIIEYSSEIEEYIVMDERKLKQRLEKEGKTITATDNRLRLRFWEEYDRVQDSKLAIMKARNFYAGVCGRSNYNQYFLEYPHKVAWLLVRPADYMIALKELLQVGLEELREVLTYPVQDKDTKKLDYKLMARKESIWKMIDMRVKGAIVQKTINLNRDLDKKPNPKPVRTDIEAEFAELSQLDSSTEEKDVVIIDKLGPINAQKEGR